MINRVECKEFDCVLSKKEAQLRIRERTEGMTWEQEVEHYREAAESGPFAEKLRLLVEASKSSTR